MKTCEDCGCRVYGGHCTNCHEEHFIMEQIEKDGPSFELSDDFLEKVKEQRDNPASPNSI